MYLGWILPMNYQLLKWLKAKFIGDDFEVDASIISIYVQKTYDQSKVGVDYFAQPYF